MEQTQIIDLDELCHRYRLKARTVYFWVKNGQIPFLRAGRGLRFSIEEVEQWLKSHRDGEKGHHNQ